MNAARILVLAAVDAVTTSYAGPRALQTKHWGAPNIRFVLGDDSAFFDTGCAHGMTKDPVQVNKHGEFNVVGLYFVDGPGPIPEPPQAHLAHYMGSVQHGTMNLTIFQDQTGEMVGPFILTAGRSGPIFKCK